MPSWNPDLYLQFANQRTRPAWDLATRARSLVKERADRPLRIVDLGCGPGNSTAVLATSFPGAEIVGLDSSPDMIQQAKASSVSASWVVADVETWRPETTFDLLFSNALLQWVPDQSALLATVAQWLAPGGVIAIQVPGDARPSARRQPTGQECGDRNGQSDRRKDDRTVRAHAAQMTGNHLCRCIGH